ncbi:MAG: hypothetical protein GXO27_00190 [Chlorobi bacterium]|nr:hypothetical protein [Chlorobiota bacterium]
METLWTELKETLFSHESFVLFKDMVAFGLVAMAAYQFALFFQRKFKFPLITGLILLGIVAGNSLLHFLPDETIDHLDFIIDLSLAIIAFSAGAELHIKELRSRLRSIRIMTGVQLFLTFILSTLFVYYISGHIPFMRDMDPVSRWAVAMLFGTVFVARSPSSAVAIINEMRARGPFTKTVMGVTVVKDVLVIILFSVTFAYAKAVIQGEITDIKFFLFLFMGITASFALGLIFGLLIRLVLATHWPGGLKKAILLLLAYGIYFVTHRLETAAHHWLPHGFEMEPLLSAITASFYVVNYTPYRRDFEEFLEDVLPFILVLFFTLTGASLSLQTLREVFGLAVLFFVIRILTLIIANAVGVWWARDPKRYLWVGWMPYVTQAGVAIGLAALVGTTFPEWGKAFETVVIAMIILNQLVGPPLFKFSLNFVHEAHKKPKIYSEDKGKRAYIFSYDNVSVSLAKSLQKKGWDVSIITSQHIDREDLPVWHVEEYSPLFLKRLPLKPADAFVLLHPDDRVNYRILEWLYENVGPKLAVATAHSAKFMDKMKKLGAVTLEPMSALVNMLEHTVRSPQAMEILMSEDGTTDTVDVEVKNPDLVGLHIRDLHLPHDVIILSLKRRNNTVFTHGYTRLRKGDILTVVGSKESLQKVMDKFEG